MLPTFFNNNNLRLIFYGGKGGTGKTTAATASALWLAQNATDKVILLVSMDPAHSLSDGLMMKFGDEAKALEGLQNLHVREFDASRALDRFKAKHGRELKLIADRGTYFDDADIDGFFDLSLPGVDEVMGILEISDLIDGEKYDVVVVDTAPTGHTLSMLKLPDLLDKWLGVFDLMEGKHKILQEHFGGTRKDDAADAFLEMMHGRLKGVNRRLRDPATAEFVVVTVPEAIVIDETERMLSALYRWGIPVHTLIVNRMAAASGCAACERRKLLQKPLIEKLEAKSHYKKVYVPKFMGEVRGLGKLTSFATWLSGGRDGALTFDGGGLDEAGETHWNKKISLSEIDRMRFILIGGKGGVGKTTAAAATAVAVAKKHPDKKVRLYSIDPAHSLGDCFGLDIGGGGALMLPNLQVFELDADELYGKFREKYQTAVENLFDQYAGGASRSSGIDFGHDRELMSELLSMAPPGLDELMALHKVTSEIRNAECIIYDTAPTGHFVRFLELPCLVREWLGATFELLLKYSGVVRLGEVAETLVGLSRDVRFVMETMADHSKSCALAVAIPEAMSIEETKRLISALQTHGVKCLGLVVNMATETSDCPFCRANASKEAVWIKKARSLSKDVTVVPYLAEDLRGIQKLEDFGRLVWQ